MLDDDAEEKEERLAFDLCQLIPKVERLRLNIGDPDDLTEKEAKEIRALLKWENTQTEFFIIIYLEVGKVR